MRHGDVWDRDVKYRDAGTSNTGTLGTLMFIAKVRVKYRDAGHVNDYCKSRR